MIDADKIISALQTDPQAALRNLAAQAQAAGGDVLERLKTDPNARNLAMVGAGGALAGLIAGKASPRFAGAVARIGGLAALGGLAYYAWRRYEARRAGQPTPEPGADFDPPPAGYLESPGRERAAKVSLMAMINAAKADGQIDTEEKARLFDRLGQVSLTDQERGFLFDELARPMDTERLVAEANTPQLAVQAYAASLMAIDPDLPAEKAYLEDLARRLNIEPGLVAEMHAAAR